MLHSFTTRARWILALSSWNMPEPSGKKKSIDGITWSFSTFRNSADLLCLDLTNWAESRKLLKQTPLFTKELCTVHTFLNKSPLNYITIRCIQTPTPPTNHDLPEWYSLSLIFSKYYKFIFIHSLLKPLLNRLPWTFSCHVTSPHGLVCLLTWNPFNFRCLQNTGKFHTGNSRIQNTKIQNKIRFRRYIRTLFFIAFQRSMIVPNLLQMQSWTVGVSLDPVPDTQI